MARTYAARMTYRRGVFALCAVLLCGGGVVIAVLVAVLGQRSQAYLPWAAGATMIAFVVTMFLSMVSRPVSLAIDGGLLRPSWRRPIRLRGSAVTIGRWVLGGIDTACGLAVHVQGPDGRVRVGALAHAGDGYALGARPVRSVDCHLEIADFDALVAELGVARGEGPEELVFDLTRSSQSAGGLFGMMAPWLITMGVATAFGLTLGLSGLGERLSRTRIGPWLMGGGSMLIVVTGLFFSILRAARVRLPEYELRARDEGMMLSRAGAVVARVPWTEVKAAPRHYRVSGRGGPTLLPVIELSLGDAHPLVVAVWDPSQLWPFKTPSRFWAPRHLVGSPQWPRLVAALRARGLL